MSPEQVDVMQRLDPRFSKIEDVSLIPRPEVDGVSADAGDPQRSLRRRRRVVPRWTYHGPVGDGNLKEEDGSEPWLSVRRPGVDVHKPPAALSEPDVLEVEDRGSETNRRREVVRSFKMPATGAAPATRRVARSRLPLFVSGRRRPCCMPRFGSRLCRSAARPGEARRQSRRWWRGSRSSHAIRKVDSLAETNRVCEWGRALPANPNRRVGQRSGMTPEQEGSGARHVRTTQPRRVATSPSA